MIKININNKNKFHIILCFLFKKFNWNHFKLKALNDEKKPYYKNIIQIKGFRSALVENYCGNRSINRFYWKIGKFYL